jgi:glycosyltransferase involved in cell wall biosynthesis
MNKRTIAYLLWEFPSYTETFILKEVLYINKLYPLYIIALKKGKCNIDDIQSSQLKDNLIYVPKLYSINLVLHHLYHLNKNVYFKKKWKSIVRGFFSNNIKNSFYQIKVLLAGSYVNKIIDKKSIQHIHAHFANFPADVALSVSDNYGITFSFSAHANDIYVDSRDLVSKIRQSAFVTTCTLYNKTYLDTLVTKSMQNKIHLMYHGIDYQYWDYYPKKIIHNKVNILFIGRLVEKKGVIYLLEAILQLIKKGVLIQLTIIGKGKNEQMLKDFCLTNNMGNNVLFQGWQNPQQIKQLFTLSDIFVLPSLIASNGDRDGIPNVILEAMASGIPVISTSVSGITEIIQHRFTGLLVSEKNSNQLLDAILTLINDDNLRISLIENAHKLLTEKFDFEKNNELLVSLFESVIRID